MNQELQQALSSLRNSLGRTRTGEVEVETRWRLDKAQYALLLEEFSGSYPNEEVWIEDRRYSQGRLRRVSTVAYPKPNLPVPAQLQEEVSQRKDQKFTYSSNQYGYRLALAEERVIPPLTGSSTETRLILRSQFLVESYLRIDLSLDRPSVGRGGKLYRLELELLDPRARTEGEWAQFGEWIKRLTALAENSAVPLSREERREVIQLYNTLINNSSNNNFFQRGTLPHPEDLTLNDLAQGTLLQRGKNSITDKADGDVGELLFFPRGVYIVLGRDQVLKVASLFNAQISPAIYQGELVEPKEGSGINSRYTFVIWESLVFQGAQIRDLPSLEERLSYITGVVNAFQGRADLTLLAKNFRIVGNTDQLYQAFNEVLDSLDALPYYNDGLIETEAERPYRNGEILIKKSKERNDLTIDFQIEERGLMVVDAERNFTLVPWRGTQRHPFSITSEELREIVETTPLMEWGEVWEFDFIEGKAVPRRPRYRKSSPNQLSTARNVWELIQNPITEATLRGHDLTLMRRYHNQVKRELFQQVPVNASYLDLGSGRGGDVLKFKERNFSLYLLEPNAENRVELQQRLTEQGVQRQVRGLAEYGAEESTRIWEELLQRKQVDAVGFMLSWTFFNQSSALMDQALQTVDLALKEGGLLLFLTLDGEAVKTGLRGAGKLETPAYSLTRREGNELLINLEETMVRNQREWLPDLVELEKRLQGRGYTRVYSRLLNDNPNLPKSSRLLSGMYQALIYQRGGAIRPLRVAPSTRGGRGGRGGRAPQGGRGAREGRTLAPKLPRRGERAPRRIEPSSSSRGALPVQSRVVEPEVSFEEEEDLPVVNPMAPFPLEEIADPEELLEQL